MEDGRSTASGGEGGLVAGEGGRWQQRESQGRTASLNLKASPAEPPPLCDGYTSNPNLGLMLSVELPLWT